MLDDVKEIHIESTSLCNAECPMCARNVNGKGLNPYITLKSLDRAWFELNLKPEQIKTLAKVFFCGNVGDPASTPELLEIIEYFKNCNPELVVGLNTNGGLKTSAWWSKLGHSLDGPLDYCVFSIDGLQDTNHLYRRNVNWQKIMENSKAFITTGASAHWDMLVFEHNKHQVEGAKSLATEAALELIEVIVCSALSNTFGVTFELVDGFRDVGLKFEVLVQCDLGSFWIVFPDIWSIIRGSHELFGEGFGVDNKCVTDLAVQFNN